MTNEGEAQSLSDRIREHLPEALRDDEALQDELARVEKLERAHIELQARSEAERAFLERAPREGLLYVNDALKLVDLRKALDGADDPAGAIAELYEGLRTERPYLFARKPESPANEKLSETGRPDFERMRDALKRSPSTHKVQELRNALRVRRDRREP